MTGFAERVGEGVELCGEEDLGDLDEFQARVFGADSPQRDARRREWLDIRNPARRTVGRGLWICRREGRIVGQQAEIPFELSVAREPCPATWAIDLVVDPQWRLRGVAPALSEAQRAGSRVVVGVDIGDAAYRSYVRGGWSDLGRIPAYLLPVDIARVARNAELRGVRSRVALAAVSRAARLMGRLRRGSTHLVAIDSFDERVDVLWSDVSRAYPVIARRDANTVRWRFDNGPLEHEYLRYLVTQRSPEQTVGYFVLRRSRWRKERVLSVSTTLRAPTMCLVSSRTQLASRGATVRSHCDVSR